MTPLLAYDVMPPTVPGGLPWYCLILHGLGDSRHGWQPVAPMLSLPQLGFVFAEAPNPYHDGFSWFDISPAFAPDPDQVRSSRAALVRLIDHLLDELDLPSERLFILGFSQGCLMTLDVGLRSPRRFAGLVGISGFMCLLEEFPAAFTPATRQQQVLLTHGRSDPLIPIAHTRAQKDRLAALGVALTWREYGKGHTLDVPRELDDIRAWLLARIATGARLGA